jgi:hypothetical protein
MPLVRMLVSAAGTNFEWRPGDEIEMSPAQAAEWADGVRGEFVVEEHTATPERTQKHIEIRRPRRS